MEPTDCEEGDAMSEHEDVRGPDWGVAGETRGGKHFGRWWVSQTSAVTPEGVSVGIQFYGYQPNDRGDVTIIDGLDAAKQFSRELLEAIEYAESHLTN